MRRLCLLLLLALLLSFHGSGNRVFADRARSPRVKTDRQKAAVNQSQQTDPSPEATPPPTPTPLPPIIEVKTADLQITQDIIQALDPTADFQLGIEREAQEQFPHVGRRRLTVFTDSTAINNLGIHTLEVLDSSDLVSISKVVLLEDDTPRSAALQQWIDQNGSRVAVYALGPETFRPTHEMLEHSEVYVWDAAMPGHRSSLHAAALGAVLEEASLRYKTLVVLDRPSLVDDRFVEGPLAERSLSGTRNAFLPLPTLPGLTAGELARLYNTRFGIQADLTVVAMQHWKRGDGNRWVDEDPMWELTPRGAANLQELRERFLTPGAARLRAAGSLLSPTFFSLNTLSKTHEGRPELLVASRRVPAQEFSERLARTRPRGIQAIVSSRVVDGQTTDVLVLAPPPIDRTTTETLAASLAAAEDIQPVELSLQLHLAAAPDRKDLSLPVHASPYGSDAAFDPLLRGLTPDQVRRRWMALPPYRAYLQDREKAQLYSP